MDEIAPGGQFFERLFERSGLTGSGIPERLAAIHAGDFGLPSPCLFANFVSSLDGIVGLPGPLESGQVISGKSAADRFLMGLLRACADAVVVGAGTFRKSPGHLWQPEAIYPPGGALFAELRQRLGLAPQPLFVLLTASGALDGAQPALRDALIVTTRAGERKLPANLPASTRLLVLGSEVRMSEVLPRLHAQGLVRVLTEGGPSLLAQVVKEGLLNELFLTLAPALFGRFENDGRKALAEGVDLAGVRLELASLRRHGSMLFLRYGVTG